MGGNRPRWSPDGKELYYRWQNTLQVVQVDDRNGVFSVPRVLEREYEVRTTNKGGHLYVTKLVVEYVFYSEDGSAMVVGPVLGEAMDSADKGANKALAVAHKYALFQTFTIPTEFTDPDEDSHPDTTPAQNLANERQRKQLKALFEYLPEVTQKWLEENDDTLTMAQAAEIINKGKALIDAKPDDDLGVDEEDIPETGGEE